MVPQSHQHGGNNRRGIELATVIVLVIVLPLGWSSIAFLERGKAMRRAAAYRKMGGFLDIVRSTSWKHKAATGTLSLEDLDSVVSEFLLAHSPDEAYLPMWTQKKDVWGRPMRLVITDTPTGYHRLKIWSAGENGRFGDDDPDDIFVTITLTTAAYSCEFFQARVIVE